MKLLDTCKILVLCVVALAFVSCGDDVYYTIQNTDEQLCGKTWTEQYTDEDGNSCRHLLEFTRITQNGKVLYSGKETVTTYLVGGTNTATYDFTWQWIDDTREGLMLNYGNGDMKHFENVWVREHYLSGKLDGRVIVLTDVSTIYTR